MIDEIFAYSLKYHPKVKKVDLPRLDRKIKETIKRAIEERLRLQPNRYGKPLQRNLKGYWKLRVGDYRVVYRIGADTIYILAILHRKDVYRLADMRTG